MARAAAIVLVLCGGCRQQPPIAIDSTIAIATYVPASTASFFAFATPSRLTLAGSRAGTTMLTATIYGLSDTVTVVVDP